MNDLEVTLHVLMRLVRAEYPERYSVAEIARTWGGATEAEEDAVRRVEARYAPDPPNSFVTLDCLRKSPRR